MRQLVKIYTIDPVHNDENQSFWRYRARGRKWQTIRKHIRRLQNLGYDIDVSILWY